MANPILVYRENRLKRFNLRIFNALLMIVKVGLAGKSWETLEQSSRKQLCKEIVSETYE